MVRVGDYVHYNRGDNRPLELQLDWWCKDIQGGPFKVLAIECDGRIICLEVVSNIKGKRRWRVYVEHVKFSYHPDDTTPIATVKKKERSW
jgi:hypothetical protein